ncbi:stress response protein NST1-like [Argentina anserina]|uniref:stress response protein NST1-like n=1 Tax=Argentina anserina TaxID=57926 RepID=UPI00217651F1|nr:stress response protein NST1-like [Potentilla anserina]
MATPRSLCRTLRHFSTTTRPTLPHFSDPTSSTPRRDTEEAAKLAELRRYLKLLELRRDYVKHVQETRMKPIMEVELMRLEMFRVEEARKEAELEQTKRLRAETAKRRAQKREAAKQQQEETLLKQKAEKYEISKKKELLREEKKKEKKTQSSSGV